MDSKVVKIIGLVGMVLGGLATLVSNYADKKEMEATVEKKVNEALAKREKES